MNQSYVGVGELAQSGFARGSNLISTLEITCSASHSPYHYLTYMSNSKRHVKAGVYLQKVGADVRPFAFFYFSQTTLPSREFG